MEKLIQQQGVIDQEEDRGGVSVLRLRLASPLPMWCQMSQRALDEAGGRAAGRCYLWGPGVRSLLT